MNTQPSITLTRHDVDRLNTMLDDERGGARHFLVERLEEEVRRARIVEPTAASGVVTLNSHVEYENLESGQRRVVELVLPSEAEPGRSRLSVLTPLGCSLIGLRPGDTFTWDVGLHRWRLRVISVREVDAS